MKRRFSSPSGSKPSQSELRLTESTGGRCETPEEVLLVAVAATATTDVPNANAMTTVRCMCATEWQSMRIGTTKIPRCAQNANVVVPTVNVARELRHRIG